MITQRYNFIFTQPVSKIYVHNKGLCYFSLFLYDDWDESLSSTISPIEIDSERYDGDFSIDIPMTSFSFAIRTEADAQLEMDFFDMDGNYNASVVSRKK